MGLANGVHHLAICTKDIKKQIEFFSQVVGAELVALYWMHGVDHTFHGFLRLSDSSSIAFVQSPEIGEIQGIKGVSHASWTAAPVAAGRRGLRHLPGHVLEDFGTWHSSGVRSDLAANHAGPAARQTRRRLPHGHPSARGGRATGERPTL